MHWPRDAATRIAEKQAKESLERYLRSRAIRVSDVWVEAVAEARRHEEAASRLERQLHAMR